MTLQELDRTIFKYIENEVISRGYMISKSGFTNRQDFENAKKDLLNNSTESQFELIEVFGVGPSEKRDETKTSKITIDRMGSSPGEIGSFPEVCFSENTDNTFTKMQSPRTSENISYDIRIITSSIKFERICQEILYKSLGNHKYLTGIETAETIELKREGFSNQSATRMIEILIRYTAENVTLEEGTIISDSIPKLTEITAKTNPIDLKSSTTFMQEDKINSK